MFSIFTINLAFVSGINILMMKAIKEKSKIFPLVTSIAIAWDIGSYLINGDIVPYNVYKINNTIIVGTAHCNKYKTLSKYIQKMLENNDNFYNESNILDANYQETSISIDEINKLPKSFGLDLLKKDCIEIPNDDMYLKSVYFRSSFFYSSSFLGSLKETKFFKDRNIEEDYFLIRKILSISNKLSSMDVYPLFLGKNNVQLDKTDGLNEKPEINDAANEALEILHNRKNKYQFFNECLDFFITLDSFELKWIDIFLGTLLSNEDVIIDKINNAWLPKIKESIDKNMKTSIFIGNAHLNGIIKELKKDYDVKKWNYFIRKFE